MPITITKRQCVKKRADDYTNDKSTNKYKPKI